MATAYLPVCTTNLQIPTVICCIHPLILLTSKTLFRSLDFLDLDVYSDDSDFSNNSEEMRHFFKKLGYPDSVVYTAQHRAQQIDRQSALQTSQKEKNERIPFTLTYHPHNLAIKNIISKIFKLLQNDNETGRIFSQHPLISFKRNKNIGNFLVRSALKSDDQPGTFKCTRIRCNACPFIHNADKITGPKRSIKITDRSTCTSANVIYCITCTLCKKIYIGEKGRRLGDRFREHLHETLKEMTRTHPNQSHDISISLIILANT